jgi:DNA-binding PadR family transcriptional regulator
LDEPHGLAIKEELEGYYESEVNHGRLYPNLDTLVEKGLVEKGQLDRRTNFYTLTRRGERELDARQDWESQYVAA